ncbi:Rrf2 family transcriptional regulator [Synechococcus sp. MW101C3]|uniref:RrF2 family transcriptional regulator n=1 Tax=Synechococcus sp. MW101C3 TaxID=210768 RepID=UPI000B9940F0|nr:Rrf2 family transcriptional regulator [Synechococcus sp. MW101C3]
MAFSAKTEYGLIALIDLADAHGTGELRQTGDICRRHGIPVRYLEQMLTALRKDGFLTSIRGPRGGFQLARPPGDITIAAVEICLEGESSNERQGDRDDPEFQVLKALDQKLDEARASLLSSTTLADLLVERNKRLQPQPMFFI